MVGDKFVFGPDNGGVRCMDGQQLFRISVVLLCRGRYPKAFFFRELLFGFILFHSESCAYILHYKRCS